jgi:hypothetical protein
MALDGMQYIQRPSNGNVLNSEDDRPFQMKENKVKDNSVKLPRIYQH